MEVTVKSFGFKYGEPYPEAALRVDLRNRIRNPQDSLPKGAIGLDRAVIKAVLGSDKNRRIFEDYWARVKKLLKQESSFVVAYGCTSGIHRSVVFAEETAARLRKSGHKVLVEHVHLKTRDPRL